MRKTILIALLGLAFISVYGTTLQVSRSGGNRLNISFTLPEFLTEQVAENGLSLNKLKVDATEEENWRENMSGLPQMERWIYIPDGFDAQVVISNAVTQEYQNFSCDKTDDPADGTDWLEISEPMVFRGNRIMSFCVKPFQYDNQSGRLTTLKSADIAVEFIPGQSSGNSDRYMTPDTVTMLKALCINREDLRIVPRKPGSYIILYNGTTLQPILQPLSNWKKEKGFDVRLVNTATIGTTNSAIKAYIQNAYDTWDNPPEYIFICGRGTTGTYYIPTYSETYNYQTVGDYHYTRLDGTDLIPDAYVGRITFAGEDELQTAVNRIINYEKMIDLSATNWLNKAFLLADTSNSGISCLTTISYVKSLIMDYNLSHLFIEAYSGSFPSQINAAINSGIGTYWYRGHGDFSGWSATDINNLQNVGKYFFFSYITCFTGNFGSASVSQSERLLRLGTPTLPKGAIGVIGASCETHTCLNNITTGGIASALYREGMTKGGPAMVRGKLALMANYPQNPASYINQYMQQINLFGDPGVDIWLKQVDEITVTCPSQLYAGGSNAAVRVTLTDGTPVEGAWVCINGSANELQITGYTDANGWVVMSYASTTSPSAKITVTKPNHRTFQTTVTVNANMPQITMQNITALQQAHAGSTLTFPITLTNNGTTTLNAVTGVLQSMSDFVSIMQGTSGFGNIPASGTAQSQAFYQIHINPDAPKGEAIYFNLRLNHNEGSIDLPFYCLENGPNVILSSASFSSNLLNHGTNTLQLAFHNVSASGINALQVHLESTHPLLDVTNPTQTLGDISPDGTFSPPAAFVLVVDDTLPEGVTIRFNIRLYNNNGFLQTLTLDKQVGVPTTNDLTGPDAYGYVCHGPGDSGYVPYNWIELEPTLGGNGINLNLSDTSTDGSGSFATINLPFQFRYYGRNYNQVTVCSNGFIMPGSQGSIEWMNWQIPGPMVPRPIIAPFWDDLLTDPTGRVLYQYDSSINAMIVQWQNLKNKYSPTLRETFQVILYDPVVHSSPTGDSPILFQYKTFNNVDAGNYGTAYIDHGQYATVGIGDHTGMDGLCYTFNNQYPPTAQTLGNFTTLYFTTLPNYLIDSELIILNTIINEINGNGNGLVDAGEQLGISLMVKNVGLGPFSEGEAVLTTTDPYVTILQSQAALPDLLSDQMAETTPAFLVDISQTCPNQHTAEFTLHISNGSDEYNLTFEVIVNAMQFTTGGIAFIDGNNDFPEPGESGQLRINVQNLSALDVQNLAVTLSAPAVVVITNPFQVVALPAHNTLQLVFNISFDQLTEQGSVLDLTLTLSVTGIHYSEIPIPLIVGVPDVFLETGFEDVVFNDLFQSSYLVTIRDSEYIHDDGSELIFLHNYSNPWTYAFLYPANANDLVAARVSFTWFTLNPSANLSLMAMYPNQTDLVTLWTSGEMSDTPISEQILLTDFPDNIDNIVFALVAYMSGESFYPVALDDLSIITLHHAPGYIAGTVNLDLHPELVTQVRMKVRYSNQTYYPDADGNYIMPAYQGVNTVTAELDGYLCTVDSLAVSVTSGQTSSGNNFSLQRLIAPINLEYEVNGSLLTLNWGLEGEETQSKGGDSEKTDRYLVPEYYRIWIRWNNLNFQDTSDTQTYSRTIQPTGTYQIYVRSVFLFGGIVELYSEQSNILSFTLTGNDEQIEAPLVFALSQNQPNPFNPSTRISFTLPEASKVTLNIYNLKGQVVKSLVSSNLDRGSHSVQWNGLDNAGTPVASGVYYYKLQWKGKELIRKMVMLK